MAYVTASVANIADLLTFVRSACTANGWTLSGNVLHKGNAYVEIVADGVVGLRIIGGTGKDGGNLLTGSGPGYAYLGTIAGQSITYPLVAEAHVNAAPDEVYVVINYATTYYSLMAWGLSDAPGLTGTGNWYYGARTAIQGTREYSSEIAGVIISGAFGTAPDGIPMFSCTAAGSNAENNAYIHGDVDARGWHGTDANGHGSSNPFISPLLAALPNAWNAEAVLLPFPVYVPRAAGSKFTLVADLKHIRHTRIDYLNPGDTIALGADKWRVYPWFRKNATERNGGQFKTHSGTLAYAVRYTGP